MKHQSPVNNADLVADGDTTSVNVKFTVLNRNYDEACLSVSWNLALSRYTGSDGQLYSDQHLCNVSYSTQLYSMIL